MKPGNYLSELTWVDIENILAKEHVALLPLGSCEPHGPHAPLSTDTIITEEMIRRSLPLIEAAGTIPMVLPTVNYGITEYASSFPGAISLEPDTLLMLLCNIGDSLIKHGFQRLFIVNNHFEPEHVQCVYRAAQAIAEKGLPVGYLDLTRKKRAVKLTDEFKSGDCHAGSYETSIVLAARPGLIKEELLKDIPARKVDLISKMSTGIKNFKNMGMDEAYCGSPGDASKEEGDKILDILSKMLAEAVFAFLTSSHTDKPGAYQRF